MSAPIILLLKSLVAGYHRKDGTYVKPHNRKGSAAAKTGAGQLPLFTQPAAPAKPNPFKGLDPVASTGNLFEDKPQEPRVLLTKPAKAGDVTETPEFKRWFGDSKVVDADGKPLKVFHGTDKEFTEFSREKVGSNTGRDNANLGFFFIADRKLAENFVRDTSGGDRIVDAYLSIKKPLRLTTQDLFSNSEQAPTLTEIFFGDRIDDPDEALQAIDDEIGLGEIGEIFEALGTDDARAIMERDGYDGVFSHFGDGNLEYIAFHPEQIKSASGNSGAFDPKSKDMTKALS